MFFFSVIGAIQMRYDDDDDDDKYFFNISNSSVFDLMSWTPLHDKLEVEVCFCIITAAPS